MTPAEGAACIPNIGPRERRRRRRFGLGMLALGALGAALLVVAGVPAGWRLLLFLPFMVGASGFFQAHEKT